MYIASVQQPPWRELTGQVIEGKYYLADFIAAGSFGGVFRADEVVGDRLMRTLAVKLLSPPAGEEADATRRLQHQQLDELQLSARLDHPNIVRCFSVGEAELAGRRLLYVVMELGEHTLDHRIAQSLLSPDELRELAFELASALDYLHGLPGGLVHRDLKPANILRIRDAWKLSDLGTARQLQGRQMLEGDALGTAEYAPPESYAGVISPAWDIWSLGVILLEAASGQLPFSAASTDELRAKVQSDQPRYPADLPPLVRRIAEGCLVKQREARVSARELLHLLRETAELGPMAVRVQTTTPSPAAAAPITPPASRSVELPRPAAAVGSAAPVQRDADAQQLLRGAILAALEDAVVTSEEKRDLNALRKQLGISLEEAARLFAEIKANPRGQADAPPGASVITAPPALREPAAVRLAPAVAATLQTSEDRPRVSRIDEEGEAPPLRRREVVVDASGAIAGSFATIAAGLARVVDGGRVVVLPGVYRESVVINKRIELVGQAPGAEAIIVESLDRHTLIMHTDHALVRGMTFSCRNTKAVAQAACAVCVPSGELTVEGCHLTSNAASCVTVFGAEANPTLRKCVIDCAGDVGVSLTHAARGLLVDCSVSGGKVAGVFIADGAEPVLRRCEISGNAQYGLLVYKGGAGTVDTCAIHDNGVAGVALKSSGNVMLHHCRINRNEQYGVLATLGARGGVTDCDIARNRRGALSIENGCHVLLRGNLT